MRGYEDVAKKIIDRLQRLGNFDEFDHWKDGTDRTCLQVIAEVLDDQYTEGTMARLVDRQSKRVVELESKVKSQASLLTEAREALENIKSKVTCLHPLMDGWRWGTFKWQKKVDAFLSRLSEFDKGVK